MKPGKYIPAPPISPGDMLRKHILNAEITQERLAKALDLSRISVNQIINGRRAITAETAHRLARVLSTTPRYWLNLQADVDLYHAELELAGRLDKLQVLRKPKSKSELFVVAVQN
jgi:addiction module HigA family antidote